MPDFVDLVRVESYLGSAVFERGRAYAENGQVLRMRRETDERLDTVRGSVVGNGGLYETSATVLLTSDGQRLFSGGSCTCPMAEDCKHVAALVVAAQTEFTGHAKTAAGRVPPAHPGTTRCARW